MPNPTEPTLTQPRICPLARDPDGHAIELPSTAVGWRVRRQTGGRPRIMLGVDKQPMQLPLGYTVVDLEDILAPGAYRLDVVDQRGEALGVTIPISIGQLRNADGDAGEDEPMAIATTLPTTGSETRLVLEANVRATQMAFLHNQKTLELGLRMAETLRDGVRVMAESQADWIKSLSSAKGFFRNARPMMLPESTPPQDETPDEEPDEPEVEAHWIDKLMPHVVPLVQVAVPLLAERLTRQPKSGAPAVELELADMLDWRRIEKKRAAALAEPADEAPPASPTALLATLPPETVQKLMHVRSLLSTDEQQGLMELLTAFPTEALPALVAHLEPMSAEQAADFLRAQLAKRPAA